MTWYLCVVFFAAWLIAITHNTQAQATPLKKDSVFQQTTEAMSWIFDPTDNSSINVNFTATKKLKIKYKKDKKHSSSLAHMNLMLNEWLHMKSSFAWCFSSPLLDDCLDSDVKTEFTNEIEICTRWIYGLYYTVLHLMSLIRAI